MAKLTVGAANDKYEKEADAVAAQVVQRLNAPPPPVQRENNAAENTVQRQLLEGAVQRVPGYGSEEDDQSVQMKPLVQRAGASAGGTASTELEQSIQRERGKGQSLSDSIRTPMENAFGANFSQVRIHTNNTADQLNQSIQAKAFTTGQDVFFRQGAYAPQNQGGQELLAHELTHVVQQSAGTVQRKQTRIKQSTISSSRTPLKLQREISYEKWKSGEDQSEGKGNRGLPGLKSDPLNPVDGKPNDFRLSLQVKVADPNYLTKSLLFMTKKYGSRMMNYCLPSLFSKSFAVPPSGMGHSWVKLVSYVDSKPQASYSLGFYPGKIENPDSAQTIPSGGDPEGYKRLALDYKITEDQWEAALHEAYEWKIGVEPPKGNHTLHSYALYGENCTTFARAITEAAGIAFPSRQVPAYSSSEGFAWVDNPNMMLSGISASEYAYDPTTTDAPKDAPTPDDVFWDFMERLWV
ncbi:DUF4157 domain-containing protein [Spirulina major]|uniref:eCIS core domain-containing protein n=1 Tax=Spirulina major TaxID=270636 RepID=UPI000A072147|nr:DUF4157 domain-containing protein [Spirulina major]